MQINRTETADDPRPTFTSRHFAAAPYGADVYALVLRGTDQFACGYTVPPEHAEIALKFFELGYAKGLADLREAYEKSHPDISRHGLKHIYEKLVRA